jgi:FkbM family methyltransferase
MNPYFHEHDIVQFVLQTLEPGDLFIDVGAMGGLYSILASHLVGPNGAVLAIEPNPHNVAVLSTNLRLNNLRNVRIIPKGVGDRNATVPLFFDDAHLERSSMIQDTRCKQVDTEMVTVDSLVDTNQSVKILKIDTEGYDINVLQGATRTLLNTSNVLIETTTSKTRHLLEQAGFHNTLLFPSQYLLATR